LLPGLGQFPSTLLEHTLEIPSGLLELCSHLNTVSEHDPRFGVGVFVQLGAKPRISVRVSLSGAIRTMWPSSPQVAVRAITNSRHRPRSCLGGEQGIRPPETFRSNGYQIHHQMA
jgi:hypothetical protein